MGLYLEGQHYDPGLLRLEGKTGKGEETAALLPDSLGELRATGRVRRFNKDNLYEYINGHAEYYLSSGFRALAVGEYGKQADGQPDLVVNLYHMGQALYAFGVLMDEAGEGAQPVEAGSMGLLTSRGLNLIHGPYYAQFSTFNETVSLEQVARQLVQIMTDRLGEVAQLDLRFPDLGETVATRFVKEDYRGLGFLDNVLERSFQLDDRKLTAFLVQAPGPDITGLVTQLTGFLGEEGIPFAVREHNGVSYYQVQDPYEGDWFFLHRGAGLLGVFSPLDKSLLKRLGLMP